MKVRCIRNWKTSANSEFARVLAARQSGGFIEYQAGQEYAVVEAVAKWLVEHEPRCFEVVPEPPPDDTPPEPYLTIIW